jgi:hypothetical protein
MKVSSGFGMAKIKDFYTIKSLQRQCGCEKSQGGAELWKRLMPVSKN